MQNISKSRFLLSVSLILLITGMVSANSDVSEAFILLKTFIQVAVKIIGDLYYELHEKKWEVYVVTEIDKTAWPSGTGIIKAGLHPDKILEYKEIYSISNKSPPLV